MSVQSKHPPKEIRLVLVRENDHVNQGEWFIPPASGTLYEWLWPGRSKEKHPVYKLEVIE